MSEFIRFKEHLIGDGFNYAYGISTQDLTGNGTLDIITGDIDRGLYWFENDGQGHFTKHVVHERGDEWIERHNWADINADGKPEMIGIDNWNGCVYYFTINGDPRDRASWKQHYVAYETLPGAYEVGAADIDGDGDLDLVASGWRKGNRYVWYENQQGAWIEHLIEGNIGETRTVELVDLNGDGRPDLLGTAAVGNELMWYENPADPRTHPWTKHVIDRLGRPMHAHAVDMDGDGVLDVLLASGLETGTDPGNKGAHEVAWYENLGTATAPGPWQKHIIAENHTFAFEAVAADLDGDGQLEVVATKWGDDGMLALFKHRGDPRGPWDRQVLRAPWVHANTILLVDVDNDGRLDIVAAAERGSNEVRWWQNLGPVA